MPVTAETVLTATAPPPVTEVVADDADVALPWNMLLGTWIKKMLKQLATYNDGCRGRSRSHGDRDTSSLAW